MARSRRDDDDDDDVKPVKKTRRPVDNEDDEDVKPKAKKKPVQPIDDDEDDDEDDAPPPKKKPVVKAATKRVADEDEDEDDDEDDTPKKNSKYKPKGKIGGLPKPLLIGGAIALLFLLCGGGALGAYFLFFNDSPKAAFEDFVNAAEKKDGAGMWERIDKKSQDDLSGLMEFAKMGPDGAKYKDKKGKELFVAVVADAKDKPEKGLFGGFNKDKPKVESYTTDGKSGSVVIKTADGKTETVPCVKEEGKWRVSFTSMRGGR